MDGLASRANCSNSTIRDYEAGRREPHRNRLASIRQALEMAGIVFAGDDGADKAGIAGPVNKTRGAEPRAPVVEKKDAPRDRQRKLRGARKRA